MLERFLVNDQKFIVHENEVAQIKNNYRIDTNMSRSKSEQSKPFQI